MKAFTGALTAMAEGDLSVRLETPFPRDYKPLRHASNRSAEGLNATFGVTARGMLNLRGGVAEVAGAMSQLSERTARQAASVEEASANLGAAVKTLGRAADEAALATRAVGTTRERAEPGAGVVAQAVKAMRRIQTSSGEIGAIIGVIDEIAFQTSAQP